MRDAQAGRVGNGAKVPLGVAKQELTFGDLIHLGPQSKVYRVRSRRTLDQLRWFCRVSPLCAELYHV